MRKSRKQTTARQTVRRPANPKAMRSGSGFHSPDKYGKADRRRGKEETLEDALD